MNITVSVGTLFAVDFEILEAEMTGCVLETKILVLEVTPFGILKISAYLCERPRGFEFSSIITVIIIFFCQRIPSSKPAWKLK